jgi:predicted Zn-dependent protease
MQDYFYLLADYIHTLIRGKEIYLCTYNGEDSEFVRFTHNKIRQAGHVTQNYLTVKLIEGDVHASEIITLSGDREMDRQHISATVSSLRDTLKTLPEDPHLLYSTEVHSTEVIRENTLPESKKIVSRILDAGKDRDLVGIYASGGIHTGFANSFGQRNWYESYSFNFDWSFYHHADKAVKTLYAGFAWDEKEFNRKMERAMEELDVIAREPHTVDPGRYRAYLSPAALYEFLSMVGWEGYSLKSHRTKQTPLLKMVEENARLHPSVSIRENTAGGTAPNFQGEGYVKPDAVSLIKEGEFDSCLVSPRSAKEFNVPPNGANTWEIPESIDMSAGNISQGEILQKLDTGVYVNNLWYLNFSDPTACRITGMTRFATFWVEKGEIKAPLSVMRFDDTIYRVLGENLIGLTSNRDFIMDPTSYEARATASGRLPGALIDNFTFTL